MEKNPFISWASYKKDGKYFQFRCDQCKKKGITIRITAMNQDDKFCSNGCMESHSKGNA